MKLFSLFLFFTLLLILVLGLFFNRFFEDYYTNRKVNTMVEKAIQLDDAFSKNGMNEEVKQTMIALADQINGRILILDYNENIIHYEGSLHMARNHRIPADVLKKALEGNIQTYSTSHMHQRMKTFGLIVPLGEFLYLFQTPIEPIEEAIEITEDFIFYLLLISLFFSFILSWFFSKTISKPLIKLSHIASQMASLNFDARWDEERVDEMGGLGNHLNFLSERLRDTIQDLESELEKEKSFERMRKQFVANVSHELQTPIALINGYAEAIQDGIFTNDEELKDYLDTIQHEGQRMSKLVKDLLDLSQLQSGSFKIKQGSFDMKKLIEDTMDRFKLLTIDRNISLFLESPYHEICVKGDQHRIEQVLVNLTQNAIDNSYNQGQIIFRIFERPKTFKIEIFNEGERIKEEDLDSLWESFYKVKDYSQGTGLGLSIVKSILDLHHSHYSIENQENGVSVYFELEKYI